MAQKVRVTFEDDLDGSPAEGTVNFALDGQAYEIDLNAENAAALRQVCARYIEHGRKLTASRAGRRVKASRRTDPAESTRIREWAKAQGRKVSERGRIPQDVVNEYESAQRAPSSSAQGVLAKLINPAPEVLFQDAPEGATPAM